MAYEPVPFSLQPLSQTREEIIKTYGNKTIRPANAVERFTVIPTGIFMLDLALLGGICESTGNQFYGWESSSKTTNCYRVVGEYQRKYPHKRVGWVDLDPMGFQQEWAKAQGVDTSRVEIVQPPTGEAAVDCSDVLAHTQEIGLIIVDGISGFISGKVIDESAEDVNVAYIAKNAGKFCSKMRIAMLERGKLGPNSKLSVLTTNQWRYKTMAFGDPRILPGGTQCNFFHQVKIELTADPISTKTKAKDRTKAAVMDAYEATFKIEKQKGAGGIRQGLYTMITDPEHELGYGSVDESESIVTYAKIVGVIEGRSPKLEVPVYGSVFSSQDAIIERIKTDPGFALYMRQATLAGWRVKKGLTPFPVDNYLGGATRSEMISPPPAQRIGPPAGPQRAAIPSVSAPALPPVERTKFKIPLRS